MSGEPSETSTSQPVIDMRTEEAAIDDPPNPEDSSDQNQANGDDNSNNSKDENDPGENSVDENNANNKDDDIVLQDLSMFLSRHGSYSLFDKRAMAIPVAAISALLCVVQRSQSETMMGLQEELNTAAQLMQNKLSRRSNIAVKSGCDLFLKYITRTYLECPDFGTCKQHILERGERFQTMSLASRDRIAKVAWEFIPDHATVLTHGWSRVVAAILQQASQKTRNFRLIILEGRPDASGAKLALSYGKETNIPVSVVLDSAMAYFMERVDLVLVGAEGVLENGGVVNKLGTAALAACAASMGKPFYVATESYKFARYYPLHQADVPMLWQPVEFVDTIKNVTVDLASTPEIQVENPPVDFTHAKYITLLFTDLGVLTPSAVSDELIRLYQ